MANTNNQNNDNSTASLNDVSLSISRVWKLYFPFDEFDAKSPWMEATILFRRFFSEWPSGMELIRHVDLEVIHHIVFDYEVFCKALPVGLQGFKEVLHTNAVTTLACLGLALCSLRKRIAPLNDQLAPRLRPIAPRFINYRPITRLNGLKADLIGKFVAIRGNVVKVWGVSPLVRRMDFSCAKCFAIISKDMPDGKFEPPTSCESPGCNSKIFDPKKESAVTVDFQRIKVQEIIQDEGDSSVNGNDSSNGSSNGSNTQEEKQEEEAVLFPEREAPNPKRRENENEIEDEGRVPRTVNVELTDELVDSCVPGDVVTVCGVVKALNPESIEGRGSRSKGKGREAGLLLLLIEANSIETPFSRVLVEEADSNNDNQQGETDKKKHNPSSKADIVASLTTTDLKAISQIARNSNNLTLARLVHSFCPGIFGHNDVKTGLILGLIGGSAEDAVLGGAGMLDNNAVSIRSDIHVLIVGEPGMGKSQMLRSASNVSPRGVYVCGNTTSATGLTVSLSRDAKSDGEYAIEAGALVLADGGVCCIDEFDKIQHQHNALLEAMEQQSISIAKAGVVASLCARTSVLAAANPKSGSYNRNRTLFENVAMSAPLLSRFDLVFMMLDRADERKDELLSMHILRMHESRGKRGGKPPPPSLTSNKDNNASFIIQDNNEEFKSFRERIAEQVAFVSDTFEPIPPAMVRKYIAYARHYVHPKLTLGASRRIQRFYLELRQKGKENDSTPITTRQLESLIRLSQARAKLELRCMVTESDAIDVISLIEESLIDALTNEDGRVDVSKSSGMSNSKQQKVFIEHLKKACVRKMNPFFSKEELVAEAKSIGLYQQILDFASFLETACDHCYLLKKPNGNFLVSRTVHGMSQF